MRVGDKIESTGQSFKCVGYSAHLAKDGRPLVFLVMRSRCAECGEYFRFTATRTAIGHARVSRRCMRHRRPGAETDRRRGLKQREAHDRAMAVVRRQIHQIRNARWLD